MTPVFLTEPEAAAELEAAALWYEARRVGLGVEFIDAFDGALARVGQWPDIGHLVRGLPSDIPARRHPFVSSIRFRRHFPKGGYDVQNGIQEDTAGTTTIL